MSLPFVNHNDFKATSSEKVWNCMPIAQTVDPVTILFITGPSGLGSMQRVLYPIVQEAARETDTPIILMNSFEFDNRPILNGLQATTFPQIYLMDVTGTITPESRYTGVRKKDALIEAIISLRMSQVPPQ